jgi:hypothetical protein
MEDIHTGPTIKYISMSELLGEDQSADEPTTNTKCHTSTMSGYLTDTQPQPDDPAAI